MKKTQLRNKRAQPRLNKQIAIKPSKELCPFTTRPKAVDSLSPADVTEMKGFKTPPVPAVAVAKTLCMFFFIKPVMIAGPTPGSKVPDYWTTAKKEVLTSDLLKKL